MNTNASSLAPDQANGGAKLPYVVVFRSMPGLALILSPDLIIQDATNAYLRETLTVREEIIGKYVFDVFPDNPQAPGTSASGNLKSSLRQVMETRQPHQMEMFRYDILEPGNGGQFLERYWHTLNTPVLDERGQIICIIHETQNVTEAEKSRCLLRESQAREQEALAQAEQQRLRLERLFEQAPAALAILEGPDLVFRVINKAYQQLFPGRKLLGLPFMEALPELKGKPVEGIARHVIETGETFEGKEVLVPVARYAEQEPEDIYWNFIYQALYDAQGQVNGMLIFALDVTSSVLTRRQVEQTAAELQALNQELEARVERRTIELRQAQAETTRHWQQLENLFMQAPSAIVILDGPDMVFQLVNPVYQQIFPGRELLNKPLLEALPELKDTPIPELLDRVYKTGETYSAREMSLWLPRYEGAEPEEIFWNFIYQARRNANGEIDGIMAYAYEITDQVKARQAIEASARQLRLVTDALPVLTGYLDKEERYRFANKAYIPWFNVQPESLLGRKVSEVVGEQAYNNVKDYIKRALAGEMVEFEATMPYRDDFTRHIRTSYVPDIRNGKVEGFYTLVTDVTDQTAARREVEQSAKEARKMAVALARANEGLRVANLDLGQANKQLSHINTDLDNFIYTASHDLRAPISNIEMLMQELLAELPEESLKHQSVNQILVYMQGAIERFKRTISGLTEITRLQKDNSAKAELLDVQEIVKEVQLDLEPQIRDAGAEVETEIEHSVKVSFPGKNLRSIVYNLLSNAIKYRHPDRAPKVKISCYKEDANLVMAVQDNGLGLSEQQREKLFSMFRRFHNHVEGTGVGLYMVKRIVDNAGGKIEVSSKSGEGSTFRIYFRQAAGE